MGFFGCIPRFIQKNATWIFTALGIGGFVGTTLLVADEAPKAKLAIEEAEQEKGGELTFLEKAEAAAPAYLPAILTGVITSGCIIAAQVLNVKQQVALVGAYGLLCEQFKEYRKEVREEVGSERERQLYISSKKKVQTLERELADLKEENGPFLYGITTLPGVLWESTPKAINNAFYHFTRNMMYGGCCMGMLYEFFGLPEDVYNTKDSEDYGWDAYENEITYGDPAGGFDIEELVLSNGVHIRMIVPAINPYELGLDYGSSDRSTDHIYQNCSYEEAVRFADQTKDYFKIEEPHLYRVSSF